MTDASKVLDDAKYSGTKEVDESLKIDAANLQPWIDAYIPNAGKINAIEQFKGGQSNPTYKAVITLYSLSTAWADGRSFPGGFLLRTRFFLSVIILYVGFD